MAVEGGGGRAVWGRWHAGEHSSRGTRRQLAECSTSSPSTHPPTHLEAAVFELLRDGAQPQGVAHGGIHLQRLQGSHLHRRRESKADLGRVSASPVESSVCASLQRCRANERPNLRQSAVTPTRRAFEVRAALQMPSTCSRSGFPGDALPRERPRSATTTHLLLVAGLVGAAEQVQAGDDLHRCGTHVVEGQA